MQRTAHPIHSKRHRINTHPCQRFLWTIKTWLAMGLLGAFVWGYPRAGKSEMLAFILEKLLTRTGERISAFIVPCKTESVSTDRKFWSYVLTSLGISHQPRAVASDLYATVLAFLREAAEANGERRVIVFFDEAHKLKRLHLLLLQDLMNDLMSPNVQVNPMFIMVGSNELPETVRKDYSEPADAALRMRFFGAQHRVYGLNGVDEVRHALAWYDTAHSEEGVDVCYTQALLPQAYEDGFRIANHADLLWRRFKKNWASHTQTGWGMLYFTVTVRMLLYDYVQQEADLTEDLVDMCIGCSGLHGAVEGELENPPEGFVPA